MKEFFLSSLVSFLTLHSKPCCVHSLLGISHFFIYFLSVPQSPWMSTFTENPNITKNYLKKNNRYSRKNDKWSFNRLFSFYGTAWGGQVLTWNSTVFIFFLILTHYTLQVSLLSPDIIRAIHRTELRPQDDLVTYWCTCYCGLGYDKRVRSRKFRRYSMV